jgi:hypothetical protein
MKTSAQKLTVWIDVDAWQCIQHWVQLAGDYEVSGLGLIEEERAKDGRLLGYHVTDVFLPEQVNGHTSTELAPDSVAKLMIEVEERFGASENLRFWWHYHPGKIGLMWSSTDDDCVDELRNGGWFVSTVFDPAMDCRTRVDLYEPLRLTVDQVPTKIRFTDFGLRDECRDLFHERVTHKQFTPPPRRRGAFHLGGLFDGGNPVPLSGGFPSAEELLLAQEALETGDLSYAEYLTLVDDAGVFDAGWFAGDNQHEPPGAPEEDDPGPGKEATS